MKTKYLILAISLIILSLSGCKKEKDLAAVFTVSDCKETVTATTAKLEATFSYPGNVKKVGVDVSENEDMSETKHFEATVDGSKLNADVSGLKGNTTYYYRYGNNTGYGTVSNEAKTFKTKDYSLPKLTSSEVSNITINSARCGGNITDDGEAEITEKGVCWSKSQNPNINGNHKASGSGLGSYTIDIDGLEIGVQYYVRAYAKNVKGVGYGKEIVFKTIDGTPIVVTSSVTGITETSAICGGEVKWYQGMYDVTVRGVCWSTSQNPTTSNSHTSNGSGIGSFTSDINGLVFNTTYYVRAYATNSGGTSYGEQKCFTSQSTTPTVTTSSVSNITQTTAKCGGNVMSDGASTVTARGVCWSTSQNPTISNSHTTDGSGTGSFTSSITGLTANTTYYVRAYATNSKGTSYGEQKNFTSQSATTPTVATSSVLIVNQTTATCGGNITSDGGATVTTRGVCWSKSQNPTINNNHTTDGGGTGSFTSNMTGLQGGVYYYVRAYATNGVGTSYGKQKVFITTITVPIVTTDSATDITPTTATCGGNVTSDGGATVTARGVCWGTAENPTIQHNYSTDGTGTGSFTSSITGLTPNTTYYVRAYATNSNGTNYGDQKSFTTSQSTTPTVTTNSVSNITETTATCGGNVTSDGGATVTARGVCWSTSQNPTTSYSHTTDGSGTGTFTSSITGLSANTTYYVRAYATNSAGTSYGSQKSFTTNGSSGGHEYVNLGLPSGLLWATCNIGATNPEDYGDYYAWGETSLKSNFSWSTYQWCNGSETTLTKYCTQSSYGYNGFVDNKTVLEPADDAAHVNWGGDWRMPTKEEWQELYNNTTSTWTTQNGVYGRRFTSTVAGHTGVSLFLPAAGSRYGTSLYYAGSRGHYWSSSLYASLPLSAYFMHFLSDSVYPQDGYGRYGGCPVRPVLSLR